MNTVKYLSIAVLVVVITILGVVGYLALTPTIPPIGANPGGEFNQQVHFSEGVINGGDIFDASSTLYIATTLTAGQVCNNSVIHVNSAAVAGSAQAASVNITMPATTTLYAECLKNLGDSKTFFFKNSSPTAATTTELLAGTGCTTWMQDAAGDHEIPGLSGAFVTLWRVGTTVADVTNTSCYMLVEQMDPTT